MNDYVRETLESVYSYIERLVRGIDEYLYRLPNRRPEDLGYTADIIDGLNWVMLAIEKTYAAHKMSVDRTKMGAFLGELSEAVENQDYTLLADILEYEIRDTLCKFYDRLDAVLYPERSLLTT